MGRASDALVFNRRTDQMAERYSILDVPVSVTSINDAVRKLILWSCDDEGRFVCIRDVHGIMLAHDDPQIMAAHHAAAMVTPDGMPLVLIGRLRGLPVQRTAGADLMEAAMDTGRAHGLRHYLYGGAPGVAELLQETFESKFPGVQIVGVECPPFRLPTDTEAETTRQAIVQSGAHVVWVGLSTPKQEHWMLANHAMLPTTLLGVGAAFDFHSGRAKRAPMWMRKSGLEWLHRLISEPRRLWRRYLVLAPRFIALVLLDSLKGRR
ncbi:WecB/TagA/CpsF family glycosyltransferase [Sphingobium sp. H39-3-25]|uniref:WecB/TagA/CpsF family glycosyltransferase n=1 Tax=Sphingobium arseniciresistens TaxID=3030834 RepID=UPI0023B8F890|nr:WecB/TagA/CpsF family glycosyltransferase [Sphingobium arseniciresistens]